jgi:hypothetical protein
MKSIDWKNCIGKSTICQIDWKGWDEIPPSNQAVIVIIKIKKQYFELMAHYIDSPNSLFTKIQFLGGSLPDLFFGDEQDRKKLIAWGILRPIVILKEKCILCKKVDCIC